MSFVYFIPIVMVMAVIVYTTVARSRIAKAVAEGQGPMLFHGAYAPYFSGLRAGEHIVALWQGVAYTGSQSGAAQAAGAALNYISKRAIGVSSYTPHVFVALTSNGRVLVSEEHSDMGSRGNYAEVQAWETGATAIAGPHAVPGHSGSPPSNPFAPSTPLELALISGPNGQPYACWLSPQSLGVGGQPRSVSTTLPVSAGEAAAIWQRATQVAATPRAA